MPLTSVSVDIETSVVLERPKVAVSAGPLGTAFAVQLAAVFQSPEMGSRSHWALVGPANEWKEYERAAGRCQDKVSIPKSEVVHHMSLLH